MILVSYWKYRTGKYSILDIMSNNGEGITIHLFTVSPKPDDNTALKLTFMLFYVTYGLVTKIYGKILQLFIILKQ